jgi:hypothetical protein
LKPHDSGAKATCNATTVVDLPEYWREHYEERAAIREYEGGQTREQAEAEALRETIDLMNADRDRSAPALPSCGKLSVTPASAPALQTPAEPCPACGNNLVPESGCWFCPSCGFSNCS